MKIAIVVPKLWYSHNREKFSADLDSYVQAIIRLGHEPLMVCGEGSEYCVAYPVKAVSQSELVRTEFWLSLNLDAALVFTWMRHIHILQAMKAVGIFVVSKGDTEGRISARVFPKYHGQRMLEAAHSPWKKACALRHWVRRRLFLDLKPDQEAIRNIEIADTVSVDTHMAKRHLARHLAFYGRSELADKLRVLPPPLAEEFLMAPVRLDRQNKIMAIGRWDDPVKDAPLLKQTLSLYMKKQPETQVVIAGSGGEKIFKALCTAYPCIKYAGALARSEIIRELADTRVLLMTSRGESFHFASHEALCLGATVVGPSGVIPLPDICCEGRFGTEARGRHPRQMMAALEEEIQAWEMGWRDPLHTANFWRSRLCGVSIIQRILNMMPPRSSQQHG